FGLYPAEFTHDRRPARWPALRQKLADLFMTRPRDHWAALFEGTDGCITPILDWDEAAEHPHAVQRHAFLEIEGVKQPAPAPRFSATPARTPVGAARAGAHSIETLRAWGVSSERISAALDQGQIVKPASNPARAKPKCFNYEGISSKRAFRYY